MVQLRRRSGFTLIEVLIVIVVIAVLAAIVVPRLLGAGKQAKESSLRAHLQELRNAVALFQAQCGVYPADLQDVTEKTFTALSTTGLTAADWNGPYLTTPDGNLPKNPITGANVEGTDWVYTVATGAVAAKAGTALDSSNYSDW